MGRAKNEQMRNDDKVQIAIGLCIEFGALEECPIHEGEYIDTMEYMDHGELTEKLSEHDPDAEGNFDSYEDMKDCITSAMHSAGDECGYCANNRDS